MTTKHFIAIARILGSTEMDDRSFDTLVDRFSNLFANQNSRYRAELFTGLVNDIRDENKGEQR